MYLVNYCLYIQPINYTYSCIDKGCSILAILRVVGLITYTLVTSCIDKSSRIDYLSTYSCINRGSSTLAVRGVVGSEGNCRCSSYS